MSLGLWSTQGTDESLPRVDSSVPLMHHDPSDPNYPKEMNYQCVLRQLGSGL